MVRHPILIISPRILPTERRRRILQQRAPITCRSQPCRDGALFDVGVWSEGPGRAAEDVGGAGGGVGDIVGEGKDAIACAGGGVSGDAVNNVSLSFLQRCVPRRCYNRFEELERTKREERTFPTGLAWRRSRGRRERRSGTRRRRCRARSSWRRSRGVLLMREGRAISKERARGKARRGLRTETY